MKKIIEFIKVCSKGSKPNFSKGFIRMFFGFGLCGMALKVLYRISFPKSDLRAVKFSDMIVDDLDFL